MHLGLPETLRKLPWPIFKEFFCRSLVSNAPGENDYSLVGFGFIHFLLWPEFGLIFKKLFVIGFRESIA